MTHVFLHCKGSTPLHVAVLEGHTDCVKKLLMAPGIDVNIKDTDGNTPVMLASGNYEILKLLRIHSEFPVHTFSKVILCGNSGAGKSTLAQVCVCLIRVGFTPNPSPFPQLITSA